uniref:NUDIX domain-containing protein n=1 Tax=Thaumasiovibrio occultus TaxID=1891184 RepID=UPI000B363582|nr:NUDIX domain-containing protein [Thaumasiovibrio occultus]
MQHRIRAAGILVNENKILMLKVHDHTGEYWTLPGGGLEKDDGDTRAALKREFLEETGLTAEVGDFLFVREFFETTKNRYHVELFYRMTDWHGEISLANLEGLNDQDYIQAIDWLDKAQLQAARVYPVELKQELWHWLENGISSLHVGSFIEELE